MLIDAFAGSMCCTLIIQLVHHCIKIFNLSLSTSMDPVFQHCYYVMCILFMFEMLSRPITYAWPVPAPRRLGLPAPRRRW